MDEGDGDGGGQTCTTHRGTGNDIDGIDGRDDNDYSDIYGDDDDDDAIVIHPLDTGPVWSVILTHRPSNHILSTHTFSLSLFLCIVFVVRCSEAYG